MAAAQLFEDLGYTGTTTNKVAEAAGISIGTLYHYIPDKDALLYALADIHLTQASAKLADAFKKLREESPGLEESLRIIISSVIILHVDEPRLHGLLYDRAPRSDEALGRLRQSDAAMADEVEWQLGRLGVAEDNRALIAALLVAGVEAQAHRAIIDADPPVDSQLLTDVLTNLWTRALS